MTPKFDRLVESLEPHEDAFWDLMYDMACDLLADGKPMNMIISKIRSHIGNRTDMSEEELYDFIKIHIMDNVIEDPNCGIAPRIPKKLPPDMPPRR